MTTSRNLRVLRTIPLLIAVCLISIPAHAQYGGGSGTTASAETNTYVFLPDQSTVVQTGGIAGVHWTYSVEGLFQLTVAPDAGTASFAHVDANATDDSPLRRTLDPNEVFNMTSLLGAVLDDTTISFTGKAADGSDVLITVTIEDDLTYFVAETIPPPNTADFFLFSLDAVAQRKYGGGCGEPNTPYLIYTAEQLNTIGLNKEDADKHFKLMADIDLSAYKGDSFNRIGFYDPPPTAPSYWHPPFTGVFDGNNHTISNFTYVVDVNEPPSRGDYGDWDVGLFGVVSGEQAQIKNLGLIDPNIYPAATCSERVSRVGAIAGSLRDGSITNCYVKGGRVSADISVGGLVGSSGGTISNCYTTCNVTWAKGRWLRPIEEPWGNTGYVFGGLAGGNGGRIYNCYATGRIEADSRVGGLVGGNSYDEHFDVVISDSYATGDVTGVEAVGGLVGRNSDTIRRCCAFGSVSGLDMVGGLVGINRRLGKDQYIGVVTNSYAMSSIIGNNYVGGIAGVNMGMIIESYSAGEVFGTGTVGGLVGTNRYLSKDGTADNCFWDQETSRQQASEGGTVKTTEQMQDPNTFLDAGWDFVDESVNGTDDIWSICEGADYPKLAWQFVMGDFDYDGRVGLRDFAILAIRWLGTDSSFWCGGGGTDLTSDGNVDFDDLKEFADNWLTKGTWSLAIPDFIIVDDFESYNDLDPNDPESNRIFSVWMDGWGVETNGAEVGYAEPDFLAGEHFVETTIVHGGSQSMPYFYDNSGPANYSEATANIANLVIDRDLTKYGATVLSMWFYGDPANAPEPMYVAIVNYNGPTAVVYHDNTDAALIDTWTEWTIDLTKFSDQGVDLTNVDTISIGFGDKNNRRPGGSGLVFFDDIRLYRPPESEPAQ